jgi:signal transduction histidine kinase
MATVMIQKGAAPSSSAGKYADAILRGADQIETMTDKLLDFTQARFGGGLPLERAPTDLADICRETVVAARITSPDDKIFFEVEGDGHGIWDRTRISEVASNLIGNAIKHGPRGGPVEIAVRGEGDEVVLAVHNGGAPIPADLLPVLFDPFCRAERADSRKDGEKSYGLGLYITREIVVAHGGDIEVSSSSEAGTTFTVRLPRGIPTFAAPSLSP